MLNKAEMNTEIDTKVATAWYAAKVYYNRVAEIKQSIAQQTMEIYVPPTNIIRSLLFFRTTAQYAAELQRSLRPKAMVYSLLKDNVWVPAPIKDKEMQMFKLVASAGDEGLEFYENDDRVFSKGEHVRVTGGAFEGAEGYILRIKGNHRLVVSVTGVCALATSYIPRCFIEKID